MDVKEAERVVIAKPVASRPTCVNFRSFSEFLEGAVNSPSSNVSSSTKIPAIRPKTVRFKPPASHSPQSEQPYVLYKPKAKLVSSRTVSFLASMGNGELPEKAGSVDASSLMPQNVEGDSKTSPYGTNSDRPSSDGYNWRKYGQKQVKGSEYPRSYYKCTHPNCPVKKKVERSLDGKIAEIVYKGEHNHEKPQPMKRQPAGTLGVAADLEDRNEEDDVFSKKRSYTPPKPINVGAATPETSCGISGDCDLESRKKKRLTLIYEAGESSAPPKEASVPCSVDTENAGDGFRWRKYGQKVVKGNPYPRSYYRCTNQRCNVRKHVERSVDDPTSFVTTYEGKHNHEMPANASTASFSDQESSGKGRC